MQRFLITVTIPTIAAWGLCGYLVFFTYPYSTRWVIILLITLFLALELSLGLILHFVNSRRQTSTLDKRKILRRSLVRAFPLALVVPTFLVLRYYNITGATVILGPVTTAIACEYAIHKNL